MSFEVPVTPRRVKVYELQHENWHDRGTGFCIGEIVNEEAYILVKSEEEIDKFLLEARIYKEVQYQKQQDTLIVWTDPDETDLALSFQEGEGCATIWEFITEVQKHLGLDDNQSDDANDVQNGSITLPPEPTLGTLPDIERSLTLASHTQYGRDSITRNIQDLDYIRKLIPLLSMAEDLESLPDLHSLCRIMKLIILMNDNTIMEQILLDEYIVGVVGILEYDPEFPTHKANHRDYISDRSRFKEVVPIPDNGIRNKIKYIFRLQYLKDVVLARLLDDPTFSMLSSMIYFYQVDVLSYLQHNEEFTSELFGIFRSTPTSSQELESLQSGDTDYADGLAQHALQKKRDAVRFIHQFCLTAKNLQPQQRSLLYTNFIKKGLFDVIDFALRDDIPNVRIAGTELILSIIDHDPSFVRSVVLKTANENTSIIDTLIDLLLSGSDFGVTSQVSEAIQILLDPTSGQPLEALRKTADMFLRQRADDPEIEMFLDSFYNQSVQRLFQRLTDLNSADKLRHMPPHVATLYGCLCDLVCAFIRLHGYRSRSFFVESNVLANISTLFGSSHKSLRLAALRCFRQCLGTNDEFYCRFLVKKRLFAPVVDLLEEVSSRNNLLNSACLEFFEFVRTGSSKPDYQRNMKTIVTHIVETYRDRLEMLTSFETIRSLLWRYDQLHDDSAPPTELAVTDSMLATIPSRGNGLRDLAPDEDEYFNTSDDEEDQPLEEPVATSVAKIPGPGDDKANVIADASRNDDIIIDVPSVQTDDKSPSSSAVISETLGSGESLVNRLLEGKREAADSNPPDLDPGGPTPLQVLGEKRRRDEAKQQEDDDELVKLSSKKTRSSSFVPRSPSSGTGLGNNAATAKKGFLSNMNKKISISFGSKRFKDKEEASK
ncbi:component of IIS longevity pathway SMK-1-domain-containing protein [Lipomyces tetrasporus]|uniref:Component of IIS longevity pathway SMK-1-domain-containing protein n=1 Tax=Lipomyces tetrasporus TaxID=54092 RepID=A0AAD7QVY0_9ASCO|nr:component of IIS longevity pathway SMK-1-domain-containing protein [Lipomyces tetrasporus]KAJ8101856.1 component of IIS longevity pathway SMK-1-domain-containing protein [Lipomyces tetrasporus]